MKYLYLECTTGGHNKFYVMTENIGGKTFIARWGKIGTFGQSKSYPMSQWNNILQSKLNKGYVEIAQPQKSSTKKVVTINREHLKKVNMIIDILKENKKKLHDGNTLFRSVNTILKLLSSSDGIGELSKDDMTYLNSIWFRIRKYKTSKSN